MTQLPTTPQELEAVIDAARKEGIRLAIEAASDLRYCPVKGGVYTVRRQHVEDFVGYLNSDKFQEVIREVSEQ